MGKTLPTQNGKIVGTQNSEQIQSRDALTDGSNHTELCRGYLFRAFNSLHVRLSEPPECPLVFLFRTRSADAAKPGAQAWLHTKGQPPLNHPAESAEP